MTFAAVKHKPIQLAAISVQKVELTTISHDSATNFEEPQSQHGEEFSRIALLHLAAASLSDNPPEAIVQGAPASRIVLDGTVALLETEHAFGSDVDKVVRLFVDAGSRISLSERVREVYDFPRLL